MMSIVQVMRRIVLLLMLLFGTVTLYAQQAVEDPNDIAVILRAAKNGDSDAQLKYGEYLLGEGEVDAKGAFRWIKKSAEQGNAKAQYMVSEMYGFGLGVKEKWADGGIVGAEISFFGEHYKAAMYIRRAARQEYAPAQRFLGETYYQISDGKGGRWEGALSGANDNKNNFYTALWWFQQAAANGDDYSAKMASVLGKRYSIDEEKMPSSRVTFPYKTPLDYQVEEWCRQYESLCRSELPSLMAGYNVPEQMLRDDPCLVWLILKDSKRSPREKADALSTYDPKNVKDIYQLYKIIISSKYGMDSRSM